MNSILFLDPVFKQQIWGGNKLHTDWGYDIPGDNTGECWAIAAHPNGDGFIVSGDYNGYTLSKLWIEKPEIFRNVDKNGQIKADKFPLLVKIIDAKDDLSIQVHPDDKYANVNENGSLGKTECWYILDAPKDAKLVVGHNAQNKEELSKMIGEGLWSELIREVPVKKGDFIQIDPGTVHAIKGGLQILETQQNSDITYRVYDYDRLTDGKPRQLHVKQSIDVITVPAKSVEDSIQYVDNLPKNELNKLVKCDYYTVYKMDIEGEFSFNMDKPFMLFSVIEGCGDITIEGEATVSIKKGDHFIIPDINKNVKLTGNLSIISSVE